MLKSLFIILLFIRTVLSKKNYRVETQQGTVEGALSKDGNYIEFLSIPYGVPVKFSAPLSPPTFDKIFKADRRVSLCAQFALFFDPLAASSLNESCLTLNIYTPNLKPNDLMPVMVFIHGGGFGVGGNIPAFYGPTYLMGFDVIVVAVNYRLNVYGFLNLGIKEAPGNAGLKDIRHALRWIQKNIVNFGGDEENVTVFGQGSGGIAALYLTLTKSCKGLFHKIISQSGTLFSPESFDFTPLETASGVAKDLGLNSTNPEELLNLYTETEVVKVEEAIAKQLGSRTVFIPSLEQEFDDEEPFLTDTPYNILSERYHEDFNPVPIFIGLNTIEGLTSILDYDKVKSQMSKIKNGDMSVLDQKHFRVPAEKIDDFRKTLRDVYLIDTSTDEAIVGGIVNMNTDFNYVGPMSLFSELYLNNSGLPVFNYIFNYTGSRNLGSIMINSSMPATANLDELFYIFELERFPLKIDEDDARVLAFTTYLWTNFAKFGTPAPKGSVIEVWPLRYHLSISMEPEFVGPIYQDRALFWRILFLEFGTGFGE